MGQAQFMISGGRFWIMSFFVIIGGLSVFRLEYGSVASAAEQTDRPEAGQSAAYPGMAESKKELQAIAAAFGTDPTAIVGYYEFHYEHDDLSGGERTENLVAIASLALTQSWLLQLTLPYEWDFPNQPGTSNKNGASDMVVRTGWRVYTTPHLALFIGTDVVFPTASSDQLGDGKYQLGPGGAVAVPILKLRSLLYGIAQDFKSVGGDPARVDISYAQLQISLNTIWSKQWWTQLDSVLSLDWNRNGKSGMTVDAQAGYQFNSRWQGFLQAGTGLWGKDVGGGYDWQVLGGVRWMFSSPLIQ